MSFNLELGKLGQKLSVNSVSNSVVITANTLTINTSTSVSNSLSVGSYLVVNTGANSMTINSTAIIFSDSTVQTTAPVAGVDSGTALAYAIALG